MRVKRVVVNKHRHDIPPEVHRLAAVSAEDGAALIPPTVSYIDFKHSESEFERADS